MTLPAVDILLVLDPVASLNPAADTSVAMIREAIRRGHRPFSVELEGMSLHGGQARAWARPLGLVPDNDSGLTRVVEIGPASARGLESFAAVLMRKDPPFDEGYLTATWILERARNKTVLINDPDGLRRANEKLSILEFPELTPETRILRRRVDLLQALDDFGGAMVVKPVLGFGGRGVLLARRGDPNLSSILEVATEEGAKWTVAQAFLERAKEGDKRILLVDGEPIGAVLRVPAAGEVRNNFHAGGAPALTALDDDDRKICARVGPWLRAQGQFFSGIDVIGGKLTEINVTSPTGMQEIDRLHGLSGDKTMAALFWDVLERKIAQG